MPKYGNGECEDLTCTHSLFVPAICPQDFFHLKCELACCQTCVIDNCLNSVNSVVEFVARNGVYFARTYILLLVILHNLVVYFLRLLYVILEVLIEGYHSSCITEVCTVIKMTLMLFVSYWL